MKDNTVHRLVLFLAGLCVLLCSVDVSAEKDKKKDKQKEAEEDPYADVVFPPPPDEPRIKLDLIIRGRADVVAASKLKRSLLATNPQSVYDKLVKPHAVEFDSQGRILVSDPGISALLRFDRAGRKMDVFGTKSSVRLVKPLGMDVGSDDTVYVADATGPVLAFDSEGGLRGTYGGPDQLTNPADVAISPDQKRLYVVDSKAHQVVVFKVEGGDVAFTFGKGGAGAGEFNHPSAVTFDTDGNVLVVDQLNCRVQMFEPDGTYVDEFGVRGTGFGNFVRPKDVAVDDRGLIYVSDFAFNNIQLFDVDFTLLTFVGTGGESPGEFMGASGVAVHGNEFAIVDQLGKRVQVFHYLDAVD